MTSSIPEPAAKNVEALIWKKLIIGVVPDFDTIGPLGFRSLCKYYFNIDIKPEHLFHLVEVDVM